MRLIDADALHAEISKWTESIMYKDWVQSAIATAPTITLTREQVEKVWRGEWIKHDGFTECSRCEYWYPSTEDEEEGDRNPFCPACGAPMHDEAVDILMERLEAMKK